jgi:prenylcysteine oxidase/farnesylcysteine lyase
LGLYVSDLSTLGSRHELIDRMETQTISAREAVARQVDEWWGLGLGECRGGTDAWDWSCTE